MEVWGHGGRTPSQGEPPKKGHDLSLDLKGWEKSMSLENCKPYLSNGRAITKITMGGRRSELMKNSASPLWTGHVPIAHAAVLHISLSNTSSDSYCIPGCILFDHRYGAATFSSPSTFSHISNFFTPLLPTGTPEARRGPSVPEQSPLSTPGLGQGGRISQ